ncbi:Uncharacterized protein GBIM_10345 [Gryllus bimaculatus]|nr:Uncharacterized protein GBIM_10345 [Gryllus bimaculatus]
MKGWELLLIWLTVCIMTVLAIEGSGKKTVKVAVSDGSPGGFWRSRQEWKARWVREWRQQKVWMATWKKVWSPVDIKEWVPLPQTPDWKAPKH